MKTTILVLSVLVLTAGCSRKIPAQKVQALETRAAALTARLPKALAGKLVLGARTDKRSRVAFIYPRGWQGGGMAGFRPPMGSKMGPLSSYTVTDNCNGTCEPKDWAATFDQVDLVALHAPDAKIVKDEKLGDSGRIVIGTQGSLAVVRAGFWKKGASRYFACSADLDVELAGAVDVFADACRATDVESW